jgi:uncharacterized protein (TIGR03790 family)
MRAALLAMLAPLGAVMSMLTSLPGSVSPAPLATSPDEMTPRPQVAALRLEAADLAVVINTADPLSVAVGNYYIRARRIARRNVARVSFDYRRDDLPESEFIPLKAAVERQLGSRIQAYALTWARPYRVGCVSITYAFAAGPNDKLCSGGCSATPLNPYFDASTTRPFRDLHIRPAMSIAALDFEHAKALIDRGVSADGTTPHGTAYLLVTNDPPRNVRSAEYSRTIVVAGQSPIHVEIVKGASLQNRTDVMFYFVGASSVTDLAGIRFLPGAMADHLTSFGGMLIDSPQMSSLRWLEAGATGSYGTVVEPCNILGKFPAIPVAMSHYLAGDTLIEAYWKSVAMPAQGLFIGEPLAAPFR